MAPVTLAMLHLGLGLCFLHSLNAQTITGSSPSSSISPLDLPINSPPSPTTQSNDIWLSEASVGDSQKDTAAQGETLTRAQSPPSVPVVPTEKPSPGTVRTRNTATRPRTEKPGAAASRASAEKEEDSSSQGLTPSLPTLHLTHVPISQPEEPPTESENADSQGLGSGSTPTVTLVVPLPGIRDEMAQYGLQVATATSKARTPEDGRRLKPTTASQTLTTVQSGTRTTLVPVLTPAEPGTVISTGERTANTQPSIKVPPQQDSPAGTTSTDADTQPQTRPTAVPAAAPSQRSSVSNPTTTPPPTTTPTAGELSTTQKTVNTTFAALNRVSNTKQPARNPVSSSVPASKTGTTSLLTPGVIPVTHVRLDPTHQTGFGQRNHSILLGHPHQAPRSTSSPAPSFSPNPFSKGQSLTWDDLRRTLAFAWELHVYGSASLFLLLCAGAALSLTLSPGINCPLRSAVVLSNALLVLAGGLRAAFFFIDPYGTRKLLPRPAVLILYNLPLHLLVWTHAALVQLALRVAGVSVLPSTMERPPLVAVLAVLQCTLLLAADLLSPALSAVVPVTLQVLSLCWGLVVCLGFLFYVFPRTRCPSLPQPGLSEEDRRKTGTGGRRIGIIFGRVLAVCALLGTLCCGLHLYATLWLYGLLGDWTRFSWGWWLVHFWARLLEVSWGFSLLLLGSWLFWRPQGSREREEGAAEGRAAGDVPCPGQSVGSSQRHTCWSKIVQSLKGKPFGKSDSNGVVGGGRGGGAGEMPNNWAGQERPGADISKSLIRNQNPEQVAVQSRFVKDSNTGGTQRGPSAGGGFPGGSTGTLLRLQTVGRPPQRSMSGSLDQDKDTSLSFCEFDLRPPSPIDLTRSIDEALHREHLFEVGSLFHPVDRTSRSPSPGSRVSQGPWLRRNSDPQLSESSEAPTESSLPLGGSVLSSVPSRQVTAPPTPSHQGHKWAGNGGLSVPSSVSCPVSFQPLRLSSEHLEEEGVDDTRPFITPDSERGRGRAGRSAGSRSYLEVSRHDESASVSSDIIDL